MAISHTFYYMYTQKFSEPLPERYCAYPKNLLPYEQKRGLRAANLKETDMFRLWAKIFQENRMLQDICISDESADTRTHKVFRSLEKVCYEFDLGNPIWLNKNIAEFKRLGKTRFNRDNFIETVDFDYLEIQIIEED